MRRLHDVPSGIPKTEEKGVLDPKSNIPKNRRRDVLGDSNPKTRMPGLKNRINLIMNLSNPLTKYAVYVLAVFIAYGIGTQLSSMRSTNNTIKMCNQKPNECKFRYDILVYNETGKVPVQPTLVPVKK